MPRLPHCEVPRAAPGTEARRSAALSGVGGAGEIGLGPTSPGLGVFREGTPGSWAGRPRFQMRRPGICGGGWGRREARERMLRQRKSSVDALRRPVPQCLPATRSPGLTPCPLERPPSTPPVSPSGGAARGLWKGRGAAMPLLIGGFPPFGAAAAHPTPPVPPRPRNQADTLPAAARPGFAAPMTWPMVGREGAGRGVRTAQWPRGDICPLSGFGAAIVSAP